MNRPNTPYSVLGVGTDLIETSRIADAIAAQERFIFRLFTQQEISYCESFADPLPHYAARFAGKEAIAKALGTGFGKELAWLDLSILPSPSGAPIVHLSPDLEKRLSPSSFILSLSHGKAYASAVALWVTHTT